MNAGDIDQAMMKALHDMIDSTNVKVIDESTFEDAVLEVYQTLLIKEFEDDPEGNVTLHGTLIQRVRNPPPGFKYFPYRINDKDAKDCIELRRIRAANFINPASENDGSGCKDHGIAATFNVSLPMKGRPIADVNYPFKVLELSLCLEMSSVFQNGKQYRPALLFPIKGQEQNFISFKVNRIKDGNTEDCFDVDAIESMRLFDYFRLKPFFSIPSEKKKKISYYPKLNFGFYAQTPWTRNIITTTIPTLLLIAMLWLNWFLHLHKNDESSTFSDYFANSLTIILALVVMIPALQDRSVGRTYLNFVDYMMIFMFVGTGIASYPPYAFIGNVIASLGLLFILYAVFQYLKLLFTVRKMNDAYSFSTFVKQKDSSAKSGKGVEKIRGEDIDLSKWNSVTSEIDHLSYLAKKDKLKKARKEKKKLKKCITSASTSAGTSTIQV